MFSELTAPFSAKVLRNERVGEVDTTVLELTSQYSLPIDVYIEPSTGAYARVVIDPGGHDEDVFNGIGYKMADGKRFIAEWHHGRSKYVYAYDAIQVNPPLEPDSLRPPRQTATWTFGGDGIPVTLDDGDFPRLFVDLTVNGAKGRFILGTGDSGTTLTDSFARRIGATQIGGIGGEVKAILFQLASVGVGGSTLHDLVVTSGLDERWTEGEHGIVGLIGFDVLGGAVVDLDLDAKRLRVMDPATVQPDQTRGIVLHPDLSTHHMRVPMKLNGKYDVLALLDSGNPLNVLFSTDLVAQNRIPFLVDPSQLGSTRYGGGIGGLETRHCGKLESLEFGPVGYRPVPACDSPSFTRNEFLVGLDFMKNFNYTFDCPDDLVVMRARKQ